MNIYAYLFIYLLAKPILLMICVFLTTVDIATWLLSILPFLVH